MKCLIKGIEYDVVEGATFCDEYNEKLSSGSIILSHIPKTEFAPYDDVYIYNDDFNFPGIPTTRIKYEYLITSEETITYSNLVETDLASDSKVGGGSLGERVFGEGIANYIDFLLNYVSDTEKYSPNIFPKSLTLNFDATSLVSQTATNINLQVGYNHYAHNTSLIGFTSLGTYYSLYANVVLPNTINFGDAPLYVANTSTQENVFEIGINDIHLLNGSNAYTKRSVNISRTYTIDFSSDTSIYMSYLVPKQEVKCIALLTYRDGRVIERKLIGVVVNKDNFTFALILPTLVLKFNFTKQANSYTYVATSSYTITNDNKDILPIKIELANFSLETSDIKEMFIKPKFYRHLLIDSRTRQRLNLVEDLYKYKITLMSETKRLEMIPCPNRSLTQPLVFSKKKSIWQYLVEYLELYNPRIKVATRGNASTWFYAPKYKFAPRVQTKFQNIIAPDFSLNNPNFRDLLNQLMIVGDCIPIVKDNVIDYLDLTKRNGQFSLKGVNFIEDSLSSEDYTNNLKKNYVDGLASKNARYVEKLGFRNSEQGLMTFENMHLETRYPIYKVNKVYMCYYKRFVLKTLVDGSISDNNYIMLVKQDITKLVKLNSERNLLSTDWLSLPPDLPDAVDTLAKYKLTTVGYDIGNNVIDGWGTIYNYPIKNSWFNTTKSYIENIVSYMDKVYPFGINNEETIRRLNANGVSVVPAFDNWQTNIVVPNTPQGLVTSNPLKLKCLFFEMDYNAFYNGTIIHTKDNNFGDLVSNDNPSSSLTLVESDGLFEKEKINRVGNVLYQINARYDSVDDIQELGSVYEDDNIIYHREYSIYQHFVKCNYFATKDYVMKNFYTSIWAKHRTYNLMSYNESVLRAENKKLLLYLSTDEIYNERDFKHTLQFKNFDNGVIYYLASCFNANEQMTSKDNYILNENINGGFLDNNFSDVNTFVSGTSLIFNVKMFDNVSGGVYISEIAPEAGIIDPNDDYTKGSSQQWLLSVDDIETGQIEKISVNVAHIDNKEVFLENPFTFNQEAINNVYSNYLYNLPSAENLLNNIKNIIYFEGNIYKDNKEQLDFTFQIEPISRDNRIAFSGYFMMLNDLVNYYYKNDVTYNIYSQNLGNNPILLYFSTINTTYTQEENFFREIPTIILNIPDNVSVQLGTIYFDYVFDKGNYYNTLIGIDITQTWTSLRIHNFEILSWTSDSIEVSTELYFSATSTPLFTFGAVTFGSGVMYKKVTLTLRKADSSQSGQGYSRPIKNLNGYTSYGTSIELYNIFDFMVGTGGSLTDNGGVNNGYAYGLNYVDLGHNEQLYANTTLTATYLYNKNMFVYYRTSGKVSESKLISEIVTNSSLVQTDLSVQSIFQVNKDSQGKTSISIDIRENSYFDNITPNSLEYWFYDEKTSSYKFVFGVDMISKDLFTTKNKDFEIPCHFNSVNQYYGEYVLLLENSGETNFKFYLDFYDSNNILLERNTVGFGVYDIPKTLISNMIYFKITPMKESDEDKLKYINVYRYQKTRTIYLSLLSNNSFEVVKDNSIVNGTILNYQEEEGVKINTYQLMKKNI